MFYAKSSSQPYLVARRPTGTRAKQYLPPYKINTRLKIQSEVQMSLRLRTLPLLKACHGTMVDIKEPYPVAGVHVNCVRKKKIAQLNAAFKKKVMGGVQQHKSL